MKFGVGGSDVHCWRRGLHLRRGILHQLELVQLIEHIDNFRRRPAQELNLEEEIEVGEFLPTPSLTRATLLA